MDGSDNRSVIEQLQRENLMLIIELAKAQAVILQRRHDDALAELRKMDERDQ